MRKKIIIIGAGGNSKVIIDIIKARKKILGEDIQILGLLDDDITKKELMGYPILGKISEIHRYLNDNNLYFIIGIGDNNTRKKITLEIKEIVKKIKVNNVFLKNKNTDSLKPKNIDSLYSGFEDLNPTSEILCLRYYTAIHPSAIIGSCVTIGWGTVVMPNVIINADCQIGVHGIINTGAIVEHDNKIGDFAHLASGVITAGNVTIDNMAFLGTGSRIIQGLAIGENTIIGAGAVVVKDIPSNCTAVGVPAKVIRSQV